MIKGRNASIISETEAICKPLTVLKRDVSLLWHSWCRKI
jgi:hypothetical protein